MLEAFKKKFPVGKPLFISFEGVEGSGKSTQIKLLAKALQDAGYTVTMTREPGGCDSALVLRKLLVEGNPDYWDGMSETLIYSAARNEHLRLVIRPKLAAGEVVITDRFADSTIVYQGAGRKLAPEIIHAVTDMVVGDTWPDVTLLLDMCSEEGLKRAGVRTDSVHENRFEQLGNDFHKRIRDGYLAQAEANKDRYVKVDATGNIEQVQNNIVDALNRFAEVR